MVILITGASHTGKTALAQRLLETYQYPYLSIDHIKMGLIRSGNTTLTPTSSDRELTAYLWPIVREMVKTAIENKQNLIVEGCYIPFDWQKDFDSAYLESIRYYCLVMSEPYIKNHFADIKKYANVIESRLDDEGCTIESVLSDNAEILALAQKYRVNYILIDDKYENTLAKKIFTPGVNDMSTEDLELNEYSRQAKTLYGKTDAYKEYSQKSATRTAQQETALGAQVMDFFARLGKLRSCDPGCEEAQLWAKELQTFFTEHYYTCTPQILSSLAQSYADGGSMTENIDKVGGAGTGAFAKEVIDCYLSKQA